MDKISNKIQIPGKTKIAVWWFCMIAALLAINGMVSFYFAVNEFFGRANSNCGSSCYDGRCDEVLCLEPMTIEDIPGLFFGTVLFVVFSSLIFVAAVKTIKGSRIAWGLLVGVFFMAGFLSLISSVRNFLANQIDLGQITLFVAFIILIPVFYLLFDRKNYFAAVEKVKKGDSGVVRQ
ncbi:MAG: hypothetical protein WCX69_01020 [Candidatus Paceibacterota bacterium]